MLEAAYDWWSAYGHFSSGIGNLPHLGEVIKYYRRLSGLTDKELAERLHWTLRYVKMLESSRNKNMPELISRRVLLAKALNIPPILLGLSSITLAGDSDMTDFLTVEKFADARSLAFYEGMLGLSWDFYYLSSVQRASKQIEASFDLLNYDSKNTAGTQLDQYDAMRCRFYQLFSLVDRDQAEIDKALSEINQAIAIAKRLKNAELIASSLLRRARIYIQKAEYELAYLDAQEALPYANLSRDPLKGKVYQMAGETQAYVAGTESFLQEKSLAYFKTAGQIARKGDLKPDGSFVKLDLTSIYIEKAKALRIFGQFDEAHDALAIASKNLSPDLTRWEINLLMEEAKIYLAQGQFDDCSNILLDALKLIRATHLITKENIVVSMYQQCKEKAPRSLAVLQLGKALKLPSA